MINLYQPSISQAELDEVNAALESGWLGTGQRVKAFTQGFADLIGRPADEFLAINSCTEGLHLAVAAMGLGPDDEVILPTVSFIGAAHAVRTSGARVVLCDVDPVTMNPSVEDVAGAITPHTRGAIVLHYGGEPGAIEEIAQTLADQSLFLIEDAALAVGATVEGRACGTLGDIGLWSFDAAKTLTTGEGGMVWFRDPEVGSRIGKGAWYGGIGQSGFDRRLETTEWWEIDPTQVGRRARMNDVAAAIGLAQIDRLPDFLRLRREVVADYRQGLGDLSWIRLPAATNPESAPAFYWVQVGAELRGPLARHLLDEGVYTNYKYWPLHRTTMYRSEGSFPGADIASSQSLLLPLHQGLSAEDVSHFISTVRSFKPGSDQYST